MNIETLDYKDLSLKKTLETAKIYIHEPTRSAIIQTTHSYIPMEQFQELFEATGLLIVQYNATKLVFDKRALRVFHQPSMEWYFTEWKERMFYKGLKTHRKILPNDPVFKTSVKIGREKIDKLYPSKKFHEMDIQYFDNINDAINN